MEQFVREGGYWNRLHTKLGLSVVQSHSRIMPSYCPFGLSASRIVGGPFGPFLSIARNRPIRYSAPVHPPRTFDPFSLGPIAMSCSRPVFRGLSWWSSGPGLPEGHGNH